MQIKMAMQQKKLTTVCMRSLMEDLLIDTTFDPLLILVRQSF